MSLSLLIATPFGFQYTKRGILPGLRHVQSFWWHFISSQLGSTLTLSVPQLILSNLSSIWTMQPLGKSYPLPDGWTNGKIFKGLGSPMTSCWALIRTLEAFIQRHSFSIGLRQGFPIAEREYEWMCSESIPKQ